MFTGVTFAGCVQFHKNELWDQNTGNMLRSHPAQQLEPSLRKKAYGISLHGDEGQGKRGRNVMIMSWSPLGMTKETMYSKFPYLDPGLVVEKFYMRIS